MLWVLMWMGAVSFAALVVRSDLDWLVPFCLWAFVVTRTPASWQHLWDSEVGEHPRALESLLRFPPELQVVPAVDQVFPLVAGV